MNNHNECVSLKDHKFDKTITNICKAIAVFLLYIHHCFSTPDAWAGTNVIFTPLTQDQMVWFSVASKVCVFIFCFLSGFGVYRSASVELKNLSSSQVYVNTVTRRFRKLLSDFVFVYILTQLFASFIGFSRTGIYGEDPVKRVFYTIIDGLGFAQAMGTPTFNGTWWYMSLALMLIFLLPLLVAATEKIGYAMLLLVFILPRLSGFDLSSIVARYVPVAVLGILCAKEQIFERVYLWLRKSLIKGLIVAVVTLFAIALCTYCRQKIGQTTLFDTISAALICFFCYAYVENIPLVNQVLAFVGKHSMNMFLVHTLIRSVNSNFHDFIYGPRYTGLILLNLILVTLALSVILEELKMVLKLVWRKLFRK